MSSGRSVTRIVTGLIVLLGGVVWLLAATDLVDVPLRAILPIGLILVGGTLVVSSRRSHPGLIVLGAIITGVLTIGTFVFPNEVTFRGVGERNFVVQRIDELRDRYELGSGELTIDLSRVRFPAGRTDLEAHVGAGQLRLIVPRGLGVRGEADVGIGEVDVFGRTSSGLGVDESIDVPGEGSAILNVTLDVGVGQIEVVRSRTAVATPDAPAVPTPLIPDLEPPRGRT